jgi:predicted DNA-binding transcriptional regulator AlpA
MVVKTSAGVATVAPDNGHVVVILEREVMVRCRLSRSQIWKLEQAGRFPKRKKYGFRRIGWLAREIDLWLELGVDDWMDAQAA